MAGSCPNPTGSFVVGRKQQERSEQRKQLGKSKISSLEKKNITFEIFRFQKIAKSNEAERNPSVCAKKSTLQVFLFLGAKNTLSAKDRT